MTCIVLDVGGPPLHLSRADALAGHTLPELLAAWLHTRRWQRERRAEDLERTAMLIQGNALIHGVRREAWSDYDGRMRQLSRRIDQLRGPETGSPEEQIPYDDPFFAASVRGQTDATDGSEP